MGTSQSSMGPKNGTPLVPPWADDHTEKSLPQSSDRRYSDFRKYLGQAVSNGSREDIKKALGLYASKASGGGRTATRRLNSVVQVGAGLFVSLTESLTANGYSIIDLNNLIGQPCEVAISSIARMLTSDDGDSEKICSAINDALSEALDGLEEFDPSRITEAVIINTMIIYITECIFNQIVFDSGKAWNKADSPQKAVQAEDALRELIKVTVDTAMAPKLSNNVSALSKDQIIEIEQQVIIDVWQEWENYQ